MVYAVGDTAPATRSKLAWSIHTCWVVPICTGLWTAQTKSKEHSLIVNLGFCMLSGKFAQYVMYYMVYFQTMINHKLRTFCVWNELGFANVTLSFLTLHADVTLFVAHNVACSFTWSVQKWFSSGCFRCGCLRGCCGLPPLLIGTGVMGVSGSNVACVSIPASPVKSLSNFQRSKLTRSALKRTLLHSVQIQAYQ